MFMAQGFLEKVNSSLACQKLYYYFYIQSEGSFGA
jgi:hypothetical protein